MTTPALYDRIRDPAYMTWKGRFPSLNLPPPMSATLLFSAQRDASYVDCEFDDHIPLDRLRHSFDLQYNGSATNWYFGPDNIEVRSNAGRRTTKVRFRIGSYRLSQQTLWNASWWLYTVLLRNLYDILDEQAVVIPFAPGGTSLNFTDSTRTGWWLYILADSNAAAVEGPTAVTRRPPGMDRTDMLNILYRHVNLHAFQGEFMFDNVVSMLRENFQIMVMVDPDYLDRGGIDLNDLEAGSGLPDPEFIVRNVLDPVLSWVGRIDGIATVNDIPVIEDLTFRASPRLPMRRDEHTLMPFWHDGRTIDPVHNPPPSPGAMPLVTPVPGHKLWRYGNGPSYNDWILVQSGTTTGLNPYTLYSHYLMPSIDDANLEGELLRDRKVTQQRYRTVTMAAPETVAELKKFVPGRPCAVRTTHPLLTVSPHGPFYWITEMKLRQPQMVMELTLVKPGDPLDDLD